MNRTGDAITFLRRRECCESRKSSRFRSDLTISHRDEFFLQPRIHSANFRFRHSKHLPCHGVPEIHSIFDKKRLRQSREEESSV
jgi:hypothetical protein